MAATPISKRHALDPDTENKLAAKASQWGVTVAAAVDALLCKDHANPVVAQRATETTAAWASGAAVAWADLKLPASSMRTLTPALGGWVSEQMLTPFARAGYGIPEDWEFGSDAVAGSARGFWNAAFPKAPTRIAPFRYGRAVGHLVGSDWQRDARGYIYAGTVLAAREGRWIDVDTAADRGPLSVSDQEMDAVLRSVICYPNPSRNPIKWSRADGMRD